MLSPMSAVPMAPPPVIPGAVIPRNAEPAPAAYHSFVADDAKSAEKTDASANAEVKSRLAGYIQGKWSEAKHHRETIGVDGIMLRVSYACNREYEPEKLRQIRAFENNPKYDPPYHPIIDVKCRALHAKLSSTILRPGDRPWSIAPTPIPEVPDELLDNMRQEAAMRIINQHVALGDLPEVDAVESVMPDLEKQLLAEMTKKAKEVNEEAIQRLDDQLREGGWYEAVKQCLYDFVRHQAAVIKGPIQKKRQKFGRVFNPMTRGWHTVMEDELIDTWERVDPRRFYPEPKARNVNDGYMIELASYTRRSLYDAIGIDGYDEQAIRRVLNQWQTGGLHEWTMLESAQAMIEKKSTTNFGTDVDCVIFWGSAPGSMLLEWGMPPETITDPDREYDVWAELIGSEVIMARLNPDVKGEKPYFKASLIEDPNRFWNGALPDILWDIAMVCCAVLRACGINAAFASGPIMDVAVDQLENRNDTQLYPRRTIRRTTKMMNDLRQVVNFYQPQIMTGPLSQFLEFCHRLADEWSGILRISHGGDSTPGGADSTASGLSMNISESQVGVKLFLSNFDDGIIGPSVSKKYEMNLVEQPDTFWASPYLDPKIVARGSSSSSMMAKEQQAVRRNEFSATLSPEEKQLMGPEGLKELLREKIMALDMDADKLLPEDRQRLQQLTGMEFPGAPEQSEDEDAESLNGAGDKAAGQDFALPMYPRRGEA